MKMSVITVVYNAAETIERTIKSVLSQNYRDLEYVIIDGGSTDGTLEIIDRYKDWLGYFVSEPDNGIYDAMNKGIRACTGDVISILNSDDYFVDENVLKIIADAYKDDDVDIVYGDALFMNYQNSGKDYIFCEYETLEDLWWCMSIPHPATFVKKSVYDEYGLFDESYRVTADHEFMLRCYSNGAKFKKIPKIIVYFTDGGFSAQNKDILEMESINVSTKYFFLCPCKSLVVAKICERATKLQIEFQKNMIRKSFSSEGKSSEIFAVIFGAGAWGRKAVQVCKNANITVLFLVDSSKDKQGKTLDGYAIVSPNSLEVYHGNILIASKKYESEIESNLLHLNNKDLKIVKLSYLLGLQK